MELFVAVPTQGPVTGGVSLPPSESEDDPDESDSDPGLAWTWRIIDLVAQPPVSEGSLALSSAPPMIKGRSLGQIFAELNRRVATILAVPMMYTVDGLVPSVPQWWSMNAAVCEDLFL